MEWEGNLKLTDSEQYDGAVELRTVDEDQLVMTLRLVRTTSSLKGWAALASWHPARCRRSLPRMWRSVIKITACPRRCICSTKERRNSSWYECLSLKMKPTSAR